MVESLAPTIFSLAGLVLCFWQIRLQQQANAHAGVPVTSGRWRVLLGSYWPVMVMIALIWLAWLPVLWKSGPAPSAERVRGWLDTWGVSASVQPESDDNYWQVTARLAQATTAIVRPKRTSGYLNLVTTIEMGATHFAKYKTLSVAEAATVVNELRYGVGIAGAGLTTTIGNDNSKVGIRYRIDTRIPISWSLGEAEFMRHVDAHERAIDVSKVALSLSLERLRPSTAASANTP